MFNGVQTFVLLNVCGNQDVYFSGFFEWKVQKNSIYLKYKDFCSIKNAVAITFY